MKKVLFCTNRNPHFLTITEYIESALSRETAVRFFDDRAYKIPGRLRVLLPPLERFDLAGINAGLVAAAREEKPDLLLVAGGTRIFSRTVEQINKFGIKTALWTIDPPRDPVLFREMASAYGYVFFGGSEAEEILKGTDHPHLSALPFACDPEVHYPVSLSQEEKKRYACDIAFVGTVDPLLYPYRVSVLEDLCDLDLGVWGPGSANLAPSSPLRRMVRGRETTPEVWRKIYAAAKLVLCVHYKDPGGKIACYQSSPRVFEALACAKLLLVDDQRDVRKFFEDGRELVIFKDIKHLRELLGYYLAHEEQRSRIAAQGREKVLAEHTYRHRVAAILKAVFA